MSNVSVCPPLDVLRRYAQSQSDPDIDDGVPEHLLRCKTCQSIVKRLKKESGATAPGGGPPPATPATPAPGVADTRPTPTAAQETVAEGGPAGAHPVSLLAPPQQPDEIGRLGNYRVLQLLGEGGMGVVFKAEDMALERLVALKVMKADKDGGETAKRRFSQEARAAAKLQHDHIVTIYQVGEERGLPYMAMQFLSGESLDARLDREPRLPLPELLQIGREAAAGLAAAHDRGLIHRDIKPANIWLEQTVIGGPFRVKILDFGLARVVSGAAQNLTQTGYVMGTPGYMAPEQARGGAKLDARCDLFSLGCVLYRMATGREPFRGDDVMATLMALALEEPPPVRDLNPEIPYFVTELIGKLLCKDPNGRPESAQAVAKTLALAEKTLAKPAARPVGYGAGLAEQEPPRPAPLFRPRPPAALVSPASPSRTDELTPADPEADVDTVPVLDEIPTLKAGRPAHAPTAPTASPTAPKVDDGTGPCPRCGAARTKSAIQGWCQKCGYHPGLEQTKAVEEEKKKTGVPAWVWILSGGVLVIFAASLTGSLLMKPRSEPRAYWGCIQLGVGALLLLLAQFWAFVYTLDEGSKVGLLSPIKLWMVVFRSMPQSRYPVYLCGWSLTAVVCALLVIQGQLYWINKMKGRPVAKSADGGLAAAAAAAKAPGEGAEDFDDMLGEGETPRDQGVSDKDPDQDEDDVNAANERFTDRYLILGYTHAPDGRVDGLVLGEKSGGKYTYVGTVTSGIGQHDKDKVRSLPQRLNPLVPNLTLKVTWVEPSQTCVLEYRKINRRGRLQDPVFKGW